MNTETSTAKKPSVHSYLLFFGIMLDILGVVGLIYSSYPLGTRKVASPVGGGGPQIKLELPRKLRLSETGIIRVEYEYYDPYDSPAFKSITMTLQAVSFATAPSSGDPITKRAKMGVPYEWIWTIRPTQVGQHYIVLECTGIWGPLLSYVASDLGVDHLPANSLIVDTLNWSFEEMSERSNDPDYVFPLTVPISVVDIFGLTAVQSKAISSAFAFLGSGLCVTWLYEQWQEYRSERAKKRQTNRRNRQR